MYRNKDFKEEEQYRDFCPLCSTLWGVDKSQSCKAPCACADYANQDYVRQADIPVGLPVPRPWPSYLEKNIEGFFHSLDASQKLEVARVLADMMTTCPEHIKPVLIDIINDVPKYEICKAYNIKGNTYDKYAERLRESGSRARK